MASGEDFQGSGRICGSPAGPAANAAVLCAARALCGAAGCCRGILVPIRKEVRGFCLHKGVLWRYYLVVDRWVIGDWYAYPWSP